MPPRHDDRRKPPTLFGMPQWLAIVVILAAVIGGPLVVVGGLWVIGKAGKAEVDGGTAAAAAEPALDATGAYDIADLRRYFIGKSEAETLRWFGQPLRPPYIVAQFRTWMFACRTRNPATGSTDDVAFVIIEKDKVISVKSDAEK